MMFYIFLILGVWRGVIGNDDLCDTPAPMVCERPHGLDFPKTEEDVNQVCPVLLRLLECMKNFGDKCGYHEDEPEEVLQGRFDVLKDLCGEDSQLHADAVQNIGCIGEIVEDFQICDKDVGAKASKIRNHLQDIERENGLDEDTYDEELWGTFHCLRQSLELACFISKVSDRCGSAAKGVVTEVMRRSSPTSYYCSVASEERLAELLALLKLELEEESTLNMLLSKE